jgi:tetratricopeptide (TPR) repeat protein
LNDKLGGLIQLMAGAAPADYQWLMKIFGISGDVRLGAEKLASYHESTNGADRLESCLILLYARQLTGEEMPGLGENCAGDPTTLQNYFLAYDALRSGQCRKVIEMLDAWHQGSGEADFAYLDLLLGEALLDILHPGAADKLKCFLDRTRGKHFVKTAWHKLSWIHFLEGDMTAYGMARDSVLEQGNMILDADRQAFREASEDGLPNVTLLRSRLLFDGGDYQAASDVLQEILPGELSVGRDSLEYVYRQARIADRLGRKDKAILKYQEVIENGAGSPWYYPSNAALRLGMIHEAMGDTVRAIDSYQACLKMNRSAYRNSIGNKARLGIRRLKEDH